MGASEFFVSINQLEIAFSYLQKARSLTESMTEPELKENNEWKCMYITTMKHYSNYFMVKKDLPKSIHYLKKAISHQQELERNHIYLPGAEFTYINLADNYLKLKKYKEMLQYAQFGIDILEKQLNITKNIPLIKSKSNSNDEKMIFNNKKFISLSYAYYLAAKSKSKDIDTEYQSIELFEKAYQIANNYLGSIDKITQC